MSEVWIAVAASIAGMFAMWLMGWLRTFLARRVSVSTPVERKVRRLYGTVRRHDILLGAITDRQAMQSQAIVVLANAVKIGNQAQVDTALALITGAENQFLSFATSHATRSDDEDDEEGGEKQ